MSIKIILADDHTILRECLASLIEKQPDMEVIAEAGDGRTVVRLVREMCPDVVIMDIKMPCLNGIEATHQIIAAFPDVKVIVLSMHSDKRFVSEIFKAGATGYLLKDSAFDELCRAIRLVTSNKIYLGPDIAGIVVESIVNQMPTSDSQAFSMLTNREREVLQLLAEGRSTKQIALNINLSAKTVESHRRHIMNKLEIHTVAELTKYAIREGLTPL
jgi:DNA-binding NarL/FixJ family response regulator